MEKSFVVLIKNNPSCIILLVF